MDEEKGGEEGSIEETPNGVPAPNPNPGRWVWVAVAVLLVITGISLDYAFHQKGYVRQLQEQNAQVSGTLGQTRVAVDALTSKINNLQEALAAQQGTRSRAEAERVAHQRVVRRARHYHRADEDSRLRQIQGELAAYRRQAESTRQDLENAKTEFSSRLNSTAGDLNSSIAHNHNELVALERRGERNYYEFDLLKAKQFNRVGPISISLRKTNVKHEYYDAIVIVNDNPLKKKHISLYEPVYFYPDDSHEALELVVNRIGKYSVHGYLSAPKYKPSELAVTSGSGTVSDLAPRVRTALSTNQQAAGSTDEVNLTHRP